MFDSIDDGSCKFPFTVAEVDWDGNVYGCCAAYFIGYSFGNIFEQPFDEIWNGEKAQKFRQQFIDRKFHYCNFKICPKELCHDVKPSLIAEYPTRVQLNYDSVCNARCIYCRDHHFKNDVSKFEAKFDDVIVPMMKNAKLVNVTASGEVFASNYAKNLINRIGKIYPQIKFYIYTNGIECNEKRMKEYGLWNRLDYVVLSLPATTKATYDKIVLDGNFKKVIDNAKFLGKLKRDGKLNNFIINFVVTSYNYKEMPAMVEFAKQNNATVSFVKCNELEFNKHVWHDFAVCEDFHPEHKQYIESLKNPIFKQPHINQTTVFDEVKGIFKDSELCGTCKSE
ncbi:MAG: SPASM domain-containing protein [Candidatus Gastranaerophilales bacterium]|nr:SPASM domain-containing protein [Candidatus Gastranaerophilales bacterium]